MKTKKTSFKEAVEATPDVQSCYKTGLTALGSHSSKIQVSNTSSLQGSLDLDTCTTKLYPNSNRWDYVFAYNDQIYFIEVHTANTREVKAVIRKLEWLKSWLRTSAPEIKSLIQGNSKPYYWIQSKKFAIPKTSRQYREVKKAGIEPIPILKI